MDWKVLELRRTQPRTVAPVTFAGPAQVRAYWEGLRSGGAVPDRAQVDPRGLGGVLDRVFLAERIGRGLVQVRIAGSGLAEAAGLDLCGLPLSCIFAASARAELAKVLEPVCDGRILAELDLGAEGAGEDVVARLVLLPLTDGADRQLVLGCFGQGERPFTAPARFTILRRQREQVAPVPGQMPAPMQSPAPVKRLRHLTLVHARD
jgi:hypothetical protein